MTQSRPITCTTLAGGDVPGASHGPDVPLGGSGPGGPSSITTSDVSRWLDSTLGDTSSPSSPIRPPTPGSEVSFNEGHLFWTAVSPLSSLGEIEEGRHNGLHGFGGGAGDHGGKQDFGGGTGLVPDIGICHERNSEEFRTCHEGGTKKSSPAGRLTT